MSRSSLLTVVGVVVGLTLLPRGSASAQTVTCSPKEFRPSLVRIARQPPLAPGTGFVIVRRDDYAVVLTAKHVLAGPVGYEFAVYFQVAPERRVPVRFTDHTILGFSPDNDVAVFRVDAQIPREVVPEDPFIGEIPEGSTLVSWGYPASRMTLCSFEGTLQAKQGGELIVDGHVEEGVSGGPTFFIDPEDNMPKLAGIVARGDGDERGGTTRAIDIRQAVTIVSTSNDPRIGNRPHQWPNIPLPAEFLVDGVLSFRRVEAGDFKMGSGKEQARRTLPVFYMSRYEVTVRQYRECVADRNCSHNNLNTDPSEADRPVVGVTWKEASDYTRWLQRSLMSRRETNRELRRLLNAGWEIDLPSEEEWEKAARRNGTDKYSWGDGWNPGNGNFNTGRLRAVNSSRCTGCAYGLFDMAGNAREWTRSLKLPYPYDASKAENPTAPGNRAIRGGSSKREENSIHVREIVRSTNRQDAAPSSFDEYTGFRLALICRKERKCNWQPPE